MRFSIITIDNTEYEYFPVTPRADSPELADDSARLMFRHNSGTAPSSIFIAYKGTMSSGWVLGTQVQRVVVSGLSDKQFNELQTQRGSTERRG